MARDLGDNMGREYDTLENVSYMRRDMRMQRRHWTEKMWTFQYIIEKGLFEIEIMWMHCSFL